MNSVNLIGRLVQDPELKYSTNGNAVVKFRIAIPRNQEISDFINCVAFNQVAENIASYFKKGNRIGISGSILTGNYENKNGDRVYTTDIYAKNITFIESKKQNIEKNNNVEDDDDFPF